MRKNRRKILFGMILATPSTSTLRRNKVLLDIIADLMIEMVPLYLFNLQQNKQHVINRVIKAHFTVMFSV